LSSGINWIQASVSDTCCSFGAVYGTAGCTAPQGFLGTMHFLQKLWGRLTADLAMLMLQIRGK
jgi:hypothetical protein